MRKEDYDTFAKLLDDAYDMISVGEKSLSADARAMFFRAVAKYPIEVFRAALHAHLLSKEGKFLPQPAHIIAQIELMVEQDGRPEGEEAWATALAAQDESNTVVWTKEMGDAFLICRPVLASSGAISARKSFLEAYTRLVTEARAERRPVQWTASLGHDKTQYALAVNKAVAVGLLPAPSVAGLLEGPAGDPTPDDKARSQLAVIRQMLADGAAARERKLEEAAEARRQADAGWAPLSPEQVDATLKRRQT